MRLKTIFLIVLFLINSLTLLASEDSFKIVKPVGDILKDEGFVSIVIQPLSKDIDTIEIYLKNNETKRVSINNKRTHYCKNINLSLGENNITISSYKNDEIVDKKELSVFYQSPVYKKYKYPLKNFIADFFHTEEKEKVCSSCHDMSVNEVEGKAFENVQDSNCYECHNNMAEKKHGHAPAVNWLCTSCHNGETGIFNSKDANKSKYIVPDPISNMCFECHTKQKKLWDSKRFEHEPAESGRCNRCHNNHSEEELFYLRKPAWELCTDCHKDKIKGIHIVQTFTRVMHPTHNVKDPSRPGKDLSCISCHNPHVSNAPSLLQSDSVMGLCSRCHKK